MSDEKRSKAYVDWRLRAPPVGHAMSSEVFLAGYDAREPEIALLRARIEELEREAKHYEQECGMCGATTEDLIEFVEWQQVRRPTEEHEA